MKTFLFCMLSLIASSTLQAQQVDEIIKSYYETIGGKKWDAVSGIRMSANVDQGGMKIPVEVVSLRDGRSYTQITLMGNTMTMAAFDGKTSWTTNYMTMQAEESPADDSENARRFSKEFPNGLVNYKSYGYTATLIGSEKVDGSDCHKIKLEKKTSLVEGKEVPSIEYYYIDKESNVPVMTESEINSGEMKGKIAQTKFSDYQEVNGVMIAFSNTSGIKDGGSQVMQFEKVEVNPTVDDSKFTFPKK
ncbi:MAG: outer membrane lipoprotein-sorting protein [Sphingobacteriales bacterium]|jgi:outer membrane lipoprotein-sorting protein|nr:outer membrane lipoprotein-sorting protein [Sphingobacteriales bacterium]